MNPEEKKYILENYKKLTPKQIANHLGLKERHVIRFWARTTSKEKKHSLSPSLEKIKIFPISLIFILFVFLGILIYSNTFQAAFQWDDIPHILEDPRIRNLSNLEPLWQETKSRFLTHLTFALNYHFHGFNVLGYHLFNLLIHLLTTVIIFFLTQITFQTPSLINSSLQKYSQIAALSVSLLFLCHPIQTQAVTYVVQRATSLATLFYLLTIFFYAKARLRQGIFYFALAFLTTVAAMFTKQIAFTLPIMLVAYEFYFLEGFKKNGWKQIFTLLPFLMTMLIIPWALGLSSSALSLDAVSHLSKETLTISRTDYLFTQFNVIRTYLRLLFLPIHQNLDYDYPVFRTWTNPATLLSFLLLSALLTTAILTYKKNKLISFGIFWFFITLSVESSFIPIRDVIFEHRLYLPMFGFALFFTVSCLYLLRNIKHFYFFIIVITVILCVLTYFRNDIWKDPVTLWQDVVRKSPVKARSYNNLCESYGQKELWDKKIEACEKAIQLDPLYSDAYFGLATGYDNTGQPDKALEYYRKTLEFNPNHWGALVNLGISYGMNGDYDEAIQYLEKSISINASQPQAYYNLGVAYIRQGNREKAQEFVRTLDSMKEKTLAEKLREIINQ